MTDCLAMRRLFLCLSSKGVSVHAPVACPLHTPCKVQPPVNHSVTLPSALLLPCCCLCPSCPYALQPSRVFLLWPVA